MRMIRIELLCMDWVEFKPKRNVMLFSHQAKKLLYKPISMFSSSTLVLGSYHGRLQNPFSTPPRGTLSYLAFGAIGGYFGLKILGTAAGNSISTANKEEKACEQSSSHRPS